MYDLMFDLIFSSVSLSLEKTNKYKISRIPRVCKITKPINQSLSLLLADFQNPRLFQIKPHIDNIIIDATPPGVCGFKYLKIKS